MFGTIIVLKFSILHERMLDAVTSVYELKMHLSLFSSVVSFPQQGQISYNNLLFTLIIVNKRISTSTILPHFSEHENYLKTI